ncbi:MAG: DNA gyrase subunit A [Rickettsiales bacterium]
MNRSLAGNDNHVVPVAIEDEMRKSYLDYAMSVIVSRAIPDVCDGLKPVHRRILYAMKQSGCDWNKPYRKSARIVGEVMGKYHPHGDGAIYQSLVRMAQDFSMGVTLVDGQGNFGSMDGDAAAAMRYTESRLAKIAHTMLEELDRDTVDFQENYDGSEIEPSVLPARFPNLLVNGGGGIAVGMATNIPPFNLGEVIDCCLLYLDRPDAPDEDYMRIAPGPDFPTGGVILGLKGSMQAIKTGRGSVVVRAKTTIEEFNNGRKRIVVTEVPYQVNKALLQEKIGELTHEKKIEGISEMRDESNKDGVRIVIELKKDANADVLLNRLFMYTQLQTSFAVNMLALDRGRPKLFSFAEVISAFCRFREEVVVRRTAFDLRKARDRAHILIGLSMAVANIDEVIRVIRQSPDPHTAKEELLSRDWNAGDIGALIALVDDRRNEVKNGKCRLTDTQAKAILDMKLARLTGLEQTKINDEMATLSASIADYLDILRNRERVIAIIRHELKEVKDEFAVPRKTEFDLNEFESDIEDLIPREDMVVTVTQGGYIKRVKLDSYRAQKRGGKGRSGVSMHSDDATIHLFVTNTHVPLLFFTSSGKVYKMKVYRIPEGSPTTKGRALVNLFPLDQGETLSAVVPMPESEAELQDRGIIFATNNGTIRRNSLADFAHVPSNGKIAMKLEEEGDSLIGVALCNETDDVLLSAKSGKAVRFSSFSVREFKSRASMGVKAMRLEDGDKVVSMEIINNTIFNEPEKRDVYLKFNALERIALNGKLRRLQACEAAPEAENDPVAMQALRDEIGADVVRMIDETEGGMTDAAEIAMWARYEQFILAITENGFGKRSSAYEYRETNRGAGGIVNIVTSDRNGAVAASIIVDAADDVMLVTNKGKLIRCPVKDVRIAGRNTQGVTIFKTADDEKVVSVARIAEDKSEERGEDDVEGSASAE